MGQFDIRRGLLWVALLAIVVTSQGGLAAASSEVSVAVQFKPHQMHYKHYQHCIGTVESRQLRCVTLSTFTSGERAAAAPSKLS
jgi:hypothetical protein